VAFVGVRGKGGQLRAVVTMKHPGARSMEFGRFNYYRGFQGNNRNGAKRGKGSVKGSGHKFQVLKGRGQSPKPFLGVIEGGHAIGAVKDDVEQLLTAAIRAEWNRITSSGVD
jgi:hypothetical protein